MRAASVLALLSACAPTLEDPTTIVTEPRLLAVQIEPPEASLQSAFVTRALWATPGASAGDPPLAWALCNARKELTEPGPMAGACLAAESAELVPFGEGATATGTVPATACRQFGPDSPDPLPGEAAARPIDPDGTGGFYQPIRVLAREPEETYSLGEVRILCGLPAATPAQATEYRERYVSNTNPIIEAMIRRDRGSPLVTRETDPDAIAVVAPGELVELAVQWSACDAAPCGGSEPYVWFDPRARRLANRREAMRVSWFADGGDFDRAHSGRDEGDAETYAEAIWRAPDTAGERQLWIVLRDDRGGVTWASVRLRVQ